MSGGPLKKSYGTFRSLGMGPLYRVEEEILRYQGGEVAHIENVLKGERRKRDHRRLKRTEETFIVEAEVTEETEKDLQSSDRFELQTETKKQQREESELQLGVEGKYQPTPLSEISTSLQFGMKNATEQSERRAITYARETTERVVSRIQQRVREERIKTTIQEFEEKNIHTMVLSDECEPVSVCL